MHFRLRWWHLLLLPLFAIPFLPAVAVMLWGRPGIDDKSSQAGREEGHSTLYRSFVPNMHAVADELGCRVTETKSPASPTRDMKEVTLEFDTTNESEMDELALKVEKALSKLAADHGAKLEPIHEDWLGGSTGHMQLFWFKYGFPEVFKDTISGNVHIGEWASQVVVRIEES
jgi:hypothetical protein